MKIVISSRAREMEMAGKSIIGNIDNGSFLVLSDEGKELLECIRNGENVETDALSDNLRSMIQAAFECNIFLGESDIMEGIDGIVSAYLHITNKCNLNCIGCYSFNWDRNVKADLSLKDIKKALDELKGCGICRLVISGGEPFARSDVFEILQYASKVLEIEYIVIATNGTLIDQDICKKLEGLVNCVSISIDGFDRDSADVIRDKGSFDKALTAVKTLKEYGLPVAILPTIHKNNYKHIAKYIELAERIDIPLSFSLLTACSSDDKMSGYILSCEEFSQFVEENNKYGADISDSPANIDNLFFRENCGAGEKTVSIDASGDVYPCHMFHNSSFLMGNIRELPLRQILQKWKKGNRVFASVDTIEACKDCQSRYFCGGGCRARAYYSTHNLLVADPYCCAYRANYRQIEEWLHGLS